MATNHPPSGMRAQIAEQQAARTSLADVLAGLRREATVGPWEVKGETGVANGAGYTLADCWYRTDAALIVTVVNNLPQIEAALRLAEAAVTVDNAEDAYAENCGYGRVSASPEVESALDVARLMHGDVLGAYREVTR